MGIGNIGWTEFLVILAFALIFFGPRRLPGIAQTIGKSLREFQKALNEVKSEMAQAAKDVDPRPEMKRILPRPSEFITTDTPNESDTVPPDSKTPETAAEAEVAMTPRAPTKPPGVEAPTEPLAEPTSVGDPAPPEEPKRDDGNPPSQDVP